MRKWLRAPGVVAGMAALLTVLSLTGCTPAPATVSSSPSAATPAVTAPAGGPVPRGFEAVAVTSFSADEAFVLGSAPCAYQPNQPCTSMVRTLNGGKTWAGLPAPNVPLNSPVPFSTAPAAVGIQFAGPSLGFVYGNGLWETSDGGQQWQDTAAPSGSIMDLEVSDGQLLAVVDQQCTVDSPCVQSLYRRALDGGSWHLVTRLNDVGQVVAAQGRVAAVLDGGSVVVTGNGGLTFAVRGTPCDSMALTAWWVTVTGPDSLALLCEGGVTQGDVSDQKMVYVSADLGADWAEADSLPLSGGPQEISAGTPARLVVGAADGAATWLYYSADGGTRWSTAYEAHNGGERLSALAFSTATNGVAVIGPGRLLVTGDGGATWQAVSW